jgi:dihydroorotate dehydrogenase
MTLSRVGAFLRSGPVQGLTREALSVMDAETAHGATLAALRLGLVPTSEQPDSPELAAEICGLPFGNPVGMAAGFDKNGQVPQALYAMGLGFAEIGTVTPKPQSGNPKPRVFRLPGAGGVVNRLGFNNEGHAEVHRRLEGRRFEGVLGVNIGANKASGDFVADYVAGVKRFADVADYLTVNISSPNTPGLRDLQSDEALKRLLGEVLAERARQKIRVPVFLKLAPDLEETDLDRIAKAVLATDLDGLIISNTTISRPGVAGMENAGEPGGLSGKPLFNLATMRLAQMRQRIGPDLPLIGVGGIHSAESAVAKFAAGANAIQLYTALVFGGLDLLDEIKSGLVRAIRDAGADNVSALTGTAVDDWASGKLTL